MSTIETPAPLIRTGVRRKLPRGLSHPVGAEVISRALDGCPQYEKLWIYFGARISSLRHARAEPDDYRFAFGVHCNNSFGTWSLTVPAVPGEERAVVRQLLIVVGLPEVRRWLCQSRPEMWYEGFRMLKVGYTIEPLQVCFIESRDHRVVCESVVDCKVAATFHTAGPPE